MPMHLLYKGPFTPGRKTPQRNRVTLSSQGERVIISPLQKVCMALKMIKNLLFVGHIYDRVVQSSGNPVSTKDSLDFRWFSLQCEWPFMLLQTWQGANHLVGLRGRATFFFCRGQTLFFFNFKILEM